MEELQEEAVENTDNNDEIETFKELGINEELCSACERIGWKKPMPIQQKVIPIALKGRDVIGLAETGKSLGSSKRPRSFTSRLNSSLLPVRRPVTRIFSGEGGGWLRACLSFIIDLLSYLA
uniref:RNA helicase n=1 Tax=Meloidogyne incognita TaxID=6306 RepID=A0A914MA17_MELIC